MLYTGRRGRYGIVSRISLLVCVWECECACGGTFDCSLIYSVCVLLCARFKFLFAFPLLIRIVIVNVWLANNDGCRMSWIDGKNSHCVQHAPLFCNIFRSNRPYHISIFTKSFIPLLQPFATSMKTHTDSQVLLLCATKKNSGRTPFASMRPFIHSDANNYLLVHI